MLDSYVWPFNYDVVLCASWSLINYNIFYHLYGGTNDDNPDFYNITDETIMLSEPVKRGYGFDGWYSDVECSKRVEKIIKGSVGDLELYAKWNKNEYLVNVEYDSNGGSIEGTGVYEFNDYTVLNATSKKGYEFYGWFSNNELLSENDSISFFIPDRNVFIRADFRPINYEINYLLDGGDNNADNPVFYNVCMDEIELQSPNKKGFVFTGWHLNSIDGEIVNSIKTSTCKNTNLYASWKRGTYIVDVSFDSSRGHISGLGNFNYEDYVSLAASCTNNMYKFVGWFKNGDLIESSVVYSFVMPSENVNLVAKFEIAPGSIYSFGKYPQSRVTDSKLKNSLNSMAGSLPSSTNLYTWNDYGYYYKDKIKSYAFYKDVDFEGNKYRAVYYTEKRLCSIDDSTDNIYSCHEENGYKCGIIYWFKYEPLDWIVLRNEDGKLLLTSLCILDSQDFSHNYKKNVFEEVSISDWLNGRFYDTAFSSHETNSIVNDKYNVRLLTREEYEKSSELDEMKIYKTLCTDYSMSQNLSVVANNQCASWWLMDSYKNYNQNVLVVNYSNSVGITPRLVSSTIVGVRPVIEIEI